MFYQLNQKNIQMLFPFVKLGYIINIISNAFVMFCFFDKDKIIILFFYILFYFYLILFSKLILNI